MNTDIQIRRLSRADGDEFEALIRLLEAVFEAGDPQRPSAAYLSTLLERPDFVACAAFAGGLLVGGATAYELPGYYTEAAELFLYDIAVHPDHQRSGIGRQLLAFLQDYCAGAGIRGMFVAADGEDAEVQAFYQGIGGRAADVVHFSFYVRDFKNGCT